MYKRQVHQTAQTPAPRHIDKICIGAKSSAYSVPNPSEYTPVVDNSMRGETENNLLAPTSDELRPGVACSQPGAPTSGPLILANTDGEEQLGSRNLGTDSTRNSLARGVHEEAVSVESRVTGFAGPALTPSPAPTVAPVQVVDARNDDDDDERLSTSAAPTSANTRADHVQRDAGPPHVHRGRDSGSSTGKQVIWSERDMLASGAAQ